MVLTVSPAEEQEATEFLLSLKHNDAFHQQMWNRHALRLCISQEGIGSFQDRLKRTEDLEALDYLLLLELREKDVSRNERERRKYRNPDIQKIQQEAIGEQEKWEKLDQLFRENLVYDLPICEEKLDDIDRDSVVVAFNRAAEVDTWPMGTHHWTKDNASAGQKRIEAAVSLENVARSMEDSAQKKRFEERAVIYREQGRNLLLSELTLMSTPAQLERMRKIITSTDSNFINDAHNWPHIFFDHRTNLNAKETEKWPHKQLAFQMLAKYVFDLLESGEISQADLEPEHKEFLGLLAPFLARIRFWDQGNSSDWEEIEATPRAEVVCFETGLLDKIGKFSDKEGYEFLTEGWNENKKHLVHKLHEDDPSVWRKNLTEACHVLVEKGMEVSETMLPFAAPLAGEDDPSYREADATLIYLLEEDYLNLMAEKLGKSEAWIRQQEEKILDQIERLVDEQTGGMNRYPDDSYMGTDFFTNNVGYQLGVMYGQNTVSGNTGDIGRWQERREIVPKGPEAAWCHPTAQVATWAARKYIETKQERYKEIHERFYKLALKLPTDAEYYFAKDSNGSADNPNGYDTTRLCKVEPLQLPEAYVYVTNADGEQQAMPCPHIPLPWFVSHFTAMMARRGEVVHASVS